MKVKALSMLFTGVLIATSLHAAANDPKGGASSKSFLSAKDHAFVTQALQSGQEEVAMAQLAQERASDAKVKDLAARIERDHQKLNAKLQKVGGQAVAMGDRNSSMGTDRDAMTNDDLDNPLDMEDDADADAGDDASTKGTVGHAARTAAHGEMEHAMPKSADMKRMHDLHGAEFDRAYVQMQAQKHQASIDKFTAASRDGSHSQAVQALARDALPTLREHERLARSLQNSLASSNE